MDSDAARATLTHYFDRFNAGDAAGMLERLAVDIVHDVNQGERQIGREAFAAFLERMNHCYSEQLCDISLLVSPDGRRASAEFVVDGRYLQTDAGLPEARGQSYRIPAGAFFALENGLITRVTMYYNLSDWIRRIER